MKIDFTAVLNKITLWIKTNGNREITATQLKEILVDILGSATVLQLQNGGEVNNIYNSGLYPADRTKSLATLAAVLNITGGKIPVIGPIKLWPKEFHEVSTMSAGTVINGITLQTGDQVLLTTQNVPTENGLYIVGENAGDTIRNENYPNAESLNGVIITVQDGTMTVGSVDESGNTTTAAANPEYAAAIAAISQALYELTAANVAIVDNFTGNLADKNVTNVALLATAVDELIVTPPILRHDNQNGYDYFASATYGSLENESKWTITRMQVQNDGTTIITHVYNSKWTDHLILNYN